MSYPLHLRFIFTIITLLIFPVSALAQIDCHAPELSADQIHEIIIKERAIRDDLPRAYPKYEYKVNKEGCYYNYSEKEQPFTIHHIRSFTLNRFGAIVRILGSHAQEIEFKCPDKVYSEIELTEIIKKMREERKDLPPPFSKYRIQVERMGCFNIYFEIELPEDSRKYLVFEIDPFGELMKSSRHKLTSRKLSGNNN